LENYYTILGIDQRASTTEVKAAYKKLALRYHPDKNPDKKEAEERFKLLHEAYKTLSDLGKRKKHDLTLGLTKASTQVSYQYNIGGFYRSTLQGNTSTSLHFQKPEVFVRKKKDVEFYLFWSALGMILLLAGVFAFKL